MSQDPDPNELESLTVRVPTHAHTHTCALSVSHKFVKMLKLNQISQNFGSRNYGGELFNNN